MDYSDNVEIVRNKLKGQVPLIGHMAVDIVEYEPCKVVVSAPLEPNINTHGTAFGGSLYCVATMAGWSLVHLSLMDAGYEPNVWVTKGEVAYLKPVTHEIKAVAEIDEAALDLFLKAFKSKGKARTTIRVVVHCDEQTAVTLNVEFAAMI